jgi:bacterioferritin-associated ferredoxin
VNDCDPHLCRCLKVPKTAVREAIASKALRTVDEVSEETEAGSACMCCHRNIKKMLDEHWAQMADAGGDERIPVLLCAAPKS